MLTSLTPYFRLFQIACFGLLLALGYYGYRKTVENGQLKRANQQTNNYYAAAQDTLRRVRDEKGRETVVYRAAPITPQVLAQLKAGLAPELREAIRQEFGRNARLLYGQRATTVTAQVLPTVALKDTTVRQLTPTGMVSKPARAGTFKDPWLSLTGIVTDDSLSVKYSIRNEMTVRAYSKKDKKYWFQFWKPRLVFVDLKNSNPNTTTPKMEAVLVEKE